MKDKEKQTLNFSVIDNKTGEYPDLYNIALKEDWAKDLMYCDMEGFSINEDGQLILSDECGKFVYCPSDRFTIVFEDSVVIPKEEYERLKGERKLCHNCGTYFQSAWSECPECGTKPNDYERGSKETAKKYKIAMMLSIQEMQKYLEITEEQAKILYHHNHEIAKQFDVEIKG